MNAPTYTFKFAKGVPLDEVAGTLRLSVLACEALYGEAEVALDADRSLDPRRRCCTIRAGTPAGRDLVKLFANFVRREFGREAFRVERLEEHSRSE